MKIERIDENSIRCTLTSLDLSSRNINLRDMTYGSAAVKRLFREMMQMAQAEVGFEPDNTPLMIEAIPLQGGSIQLIITKVEDPEELDTRFSKFSADSMSPNGWISQLASEILEGAQDLIKQFRDNNTAIPLPGPVAQPTVRIYCFDSLDKVTEAAKCIDSLYNGANTLYKNDRNGHYYLVLHSDSAENDNFTRVANLLAEFGRKVNGEALNEAYYQEHYEIIIKEDALHRLARL